MTSNMRQITPACLPADPGVTSLLSKLAPIFDRIDGLEGVEMTFVMEDEMRTPLSSLVLGVRTQLEDGPGIYMTQWAEHLDRYLPAEQVFRFQQTVLGAVPAAVAIERLGAGCPDENIRQAAFTVFITRDALHVSLADTSRMFMNLPADIPEWQRQMVLTIMPRQARSNHDRLHLIQAIERSHAIWLEAYDHALGRYQRSYRVDIGSPERADIEASLKE